MPRFKNVHTHTSDTSFRARAFCIYLVVQNEVWRPPAGCPGCERRGPKAAGQGWQKARSLRARSAERARCAKRRSRVLVLLEQDRLGQQAREAQETPADQVFDMLRPRICVINLLAIASAVLAEMVDCDSEQNGTCIVNSARSATQLVLAYDGDVEI